MMKLILLCLAIAPAVSAHSVERNLVLDTNQQRSLRRQLAMQRAHEEDGMSAADEYQHLYADEELGKGASRLEVLEVRNELEDARKEIKYQTNMLKGVMVEVNDLESDYRRRLSLLSMNRAPARPTDSEIQKSKNEACTDTQPPLDGWWGNPTCESQRSYTDACEKRRSGELNDGYCAQTCGLCQVSDSSESAETTESGKKIRRSHEKASGKTKFLEKVQKKKGKSAKSTEKTHSAKKKTRSHAGAKAAQHNFGRLASEPHGLLMLFLLCRLGFATLA
mmetsp:Transcript_85023/g.147526  ORF Transcript_85023/g.147526 Transcript_85023/m.147526 type:complete len:278 (-) Transcript_85023:139-972(-)